MASIFTSTVSVAWFFDDPCCDCSVESGFENMEEHGDTVSGQVTLCVENKEAEQIVTL